MRRASPRLALAVIFFVLALAMGFTLLPLSFASAPAQASPLAAPSKTVTDTVFISETMVFTRHADLVSLIGDHHTTTTLQDGRVLVINGNEQTAQIYDPSTETFVPTGNLLLKHHGHRAVLLNDGRVLVVGTPYPIPCCEFQNDAELYDPTTGTFALTGSTNDPHIYGHTATLLQDGTVLVAGGEGIADTENGASSQRSAELYDPATGVFTRVSPMDDGRYEHSATLLPNGSVLIAGGFGGWSWTMNGGYNEYCPPRALIYNPSTREFTQGSTLPSAYYRSICGAHQAVLLPNNSIVIPGRRTLFYDLDTNQFTGVNMPYAEANFAYRSAISLPNGEIFLAGSITNDIFDPNTSLIRDAPSLVGGHHWRRATLLEDGTVLVTGYTNSVPERSEIGTLVPGNTFSGTLTSPLGWQNSRTVTVSFTGTTSDAPLNMGTVVRWDTNSEHSERAWNWVPAAGGDVVTTTYSYDSDGTLPLYLYLMDANGNFGRVLTSTVNIDTVLPASTMSALPATSSNAIPLAWSGSDDRSGVASYEVQVRQGTAGEWTTILSNTKVLSTTYQAGSGRTYSFRVRAIDAAGNAEEWPSTYDRTTRVPNVFTGTLELPDGWLTTQAGSISVSGTSTGDDVAAAALSNNGLSWGPWFTLTPGVTETVTWNFASDGANQSVYLRLQDSYGDVGPAASGTVNVDTVAPASAMQALPPTQASTIVTLSWSGSDATSGMGSYDVQVREGTGGEWTPLLSATSATETTFTGQHGITYYFRARAHDVAGNVEAWPSSYDTKTLVDTAAPTGSVTINAGAHATTARQVTLYLPASDAHNPVSQMRLSTNGTTWGDWQTRASPFNYTVPQGDGLQTVYAQYRDAAGNASAVFSDAIRLDEAAGSDELVTINNGALWTNSTSVTLTISAPARTSNMRLSNDGGFANAAWQLFESRPDWELIPYGSYAIPRTVYVRVRNIDGTESTVYSDEIIYDPVPPTGTLSIQSVTSNSVNVNLSANDPDNLSGVAFMRVALTSNLSQVAWQPYASLRTLPRNGTAPENVRAYAQFRDGAGNVSTVVCAAANGSCPAGGSTATATATRTPTRTPTRTITATATRTSTRTPTATVTTTGTAVATGTRTPTRTPTATITTTGTAVATGTRTPTAIASVTASTTRTTTATAVATVTGTRTATVTALPSGTATRTTTATRTVSPTRTITVTRTPTVSVTETPDAHKVYLPIIVQRR